MDTVPTNGITIGIDVLVTHRYQSIPELTKKAPARNFRTSRYLIVTYRAASPEITMYSKSQIGNDEASQFGNMRDTQFMDV